MPKLAHFKGEPIDDRPPQGVDSFSHYILEESIKNAPDERIAYALTGENREVTFGELRDKAVRLAHGLVAAGWAEPGQVVCIFAHNMPEFVIVQQACVAVGLTPTLCNSLYSAYEVHHQLKDSDSVAVFTVADRSFVEKVVSAVYNLHKDPSATPDCRVKEIILLSEERELVDGVDLRGLKLSHYLDYLAPSDPSLKSYPPLSINLDTHRAYIPYSSGTTGLSKGVALTHKNMFSQTIQTRSTFKIKPGESLFAVPPLFHIYGVMLTGNISVALGITAVIQTRFDFAAMLESVPKYKVSRLAAVPPIVLAIAKHPLVDKYDMSTVSEIVSGAAPMPSEQIKVAVDRMKNPNGTRFTQGYGLTEIGASITMTRPDTPPALFEAGTVGVVNPASELRIVDLATMETAECGAQGEVWMRSNSVMQGYLNRDQETANTITQDGWLRSGDLGHCNEEGYLWITDRLKELIKYKGYQVPPAQLEALLLTHAGVEDCAVIGVPDEEAGELPRAYVKPKPHHAPSEEDIKAFVKERVAPYKQLKGGVVLVDSIPKSASGKILRRVLKDQYAEQQGHK